LKVLLSWTGDVRCVQTVRDRAILSIDFLLHNTEGDSSMSDAYEPKHVVTPELVNRAMAVFSTDEKTARKIIDFGVILAMEKMKKWTSNMRRRQKERAEEIYKLTKQLKREKGSNLAVNEIEKKILELCVEHE